MVKTIERENQQIHQCNECGLGYEDLETAERCENHCKTYNSCSLEITSHAILK
ncbi:DUF7128 family protein [Candidatus Nitrosotenuis uzonensis]|uniref:DUF7128 domain-containing protein n=1 Tax=Candidatus Nitrosotenuis uzonensis TaxID=1407055 RepID=A0A812F4D2_9ARCH|nr:hypothetical protein [Candidatus Nitrosotenuis uzonensis]CAE6500863.1 conserved hypothetical protein [Candidatus Nitrosotenuis uzonensis]